jgi:UTP--glucose-1-phosphate uridylyltransferase
MTTSTTTTRKPVRKAVIAAAGYGSRFLPLTKAIPKEMLPLVDKPVLQHIVEELVTAGITDIIIVTSDGKPSIEEHFGPVSDGLRQNLLDGKKTALLDKAEAVATIANFTFVKQEGPYGNATPLLCAAPYLNEEPFIYAFADDFIESSPNRSEQLIAEYNAHGGSVLTCVRLDREADYGRYGYVGGTAIGDTLIEMNTIIEKPGSRELSPSSLASVGGYLLEPMIIDYIRKDLAAYDGSKELQIQTSMQLMMEDGLAFYGREITSGRYYDTGNPLEYMKTVFDFALKHPDIGAAFREYVRNQDLDQNEQIKKTRKPTIRKTAPKKTNSLIVELAR